MSLKSADAVNAPDLQLIRARVRQAWAKALAIDLHAVEEDRSFFELGGYSLLAISLAGEIGADLGLPVPASAILSHNTLAAFCAFLLGQADKPDGGQQGGDLPSLAGIEWSEGEAFPMTELQQGYWVGENGSLELSGPAFFYGIYRARSLDAERLEAAMNQLFRRHGMFRTVFTEDGRQKTFPRVPAYKLKRVDLRGASDAEVRREYERLRDEIIRNQGGLKEWPLFHLMVLETGAFSYVFNFGKLIITDGRSGEILAADLMALMQGRHLPEIGMAFQGYMNALERFKETPKYRAANRFWREKASELTGPPELPLLHVPETREGPRPMVRRSLLLDARTWRNLRSMSQRFGVTPSMAMCSAYCSVIAFWSKNQDFTINVMYANRPAVHPDVNLVIGNFSNTVLLGYRTSDRESFLARTRRMQEDFFQTLEHGFVSGITAIREINAQSGGSKPFIVPYVFASGLGLGSGEGPEEPLYLEKLGWEHVESGIHTPQVILDHQVAENAGQLQINWDSKDHLLPVGMVQEMFDAYVALLRRMAEDAGTWSQEKLNFLPEIQRQTRLRINSTRVPLPNARPLHKGFLEQAMRTPGATALIDGGGEMTYGRLLAASLGIASAISAAGGSGRMVAIVMEKGWKQVAGALGALIAGGTYVPIPATSPLARAEAILSKLPDHLVLTVGSCPLGARLLRDRPGLDLDRIDLPTKYYGDASAKFPDPSPESLAYIIFTSGSTGEPKGVAVTHSAALNTVIDINSRFEVGPKDAVLGISELAFDLSVYDIFGILTAGGTLVLPEDEHIRNPFYLAGLVEKHGITLWNSVPAFAEMAAEAAGTMPTLPLQSLRLVLLSGDWIPVHLPARLRGRAPAARIVSLGGATEASVWSIHYEIGDVDPSWKSIPYGFPLANQKMFVLDPNLRDRPNWVPGDIFIGGVGLASGYYGDEAKTSASFFVNPHTGERIYRTGDKGRYWKDGWIEFLGREDAQVKVRGYRIELGEIEAAARAIPGVKDCLCLVVGEGNKKQITAFLTGELEPGFDLHRFNAALAGRVPAYMLPGAMHRLASFPLTSNGKVERKALLALAAGPAKAPAAGGAALSRLESVLLEIYRSETGSAECGPDDSFFDLGGNSISAVRIINEMNSLTDKQLPLGILYEHPTVRSLARRVEAWNAVEWDSLVNIAVSGKEKAVLCIHPIGGNILGYMAASRLLAPGYDVYGVQARGLHNGLQPHRTIEAMAAYYTSKTEPVISKHSEVILLGWSMGGLIAMEMARRPAWNGRLKSVILVDTKVRKESLAAGAGPSPAEMMREFFKDLCGGADVLEGVSFSSNFPRENVAEALETAKRRGFDLQLKADTVLPLYRLYEANLGAVLSHSLRDPGVPVRLFETEPRGGFAFFQDPQEDLAARIPGLRRSIVPDASHYTILSERNFPLILSEAF